MGVESMIHTAYDVMKEFLITNADLDGKYGIPKIPKTFIHPGKDTVDFAESFSRKIKNHRELDVNFYGLEPDGIYMTLSEKSRS